MIKQLDIRILKHYLRDFPAIFGSCLFILLIILAIFAPTISPQNPYNPRELSLRDSLLPPIWMEGGKQPFVLGTDDQGRDTFSTILYGCRTSLTVGFCVTLIASITGVAIGITAGYYAGILDAVMMRLADTIFSFSSILLAMFLLGIFKEGGILLVMFAIIVTNWVSYARTMRSAVLSIKEEEYIEAAKAAGASNLRIIFRHILPNAITPVLVVAAVSFGTVVMLEATLSFLGIGVPVNKPSLGMMISSGKNHIYAGRWWLIVFPGMALMSIVFSVNLIADWLREEINPKLRKR